MKTKKYLAGILIASLMLGCQIKAEVNGKEEAVVAKNKAVILGVSGVLIALVGGVFGGYFFNEYLGKDGEKKNKELLEKEFNDKLEKALLEQKNRLEENNKKQPVDSDEVKVFETELKNIITDNKAIKNIKTEYNTLGVEIDNLRKKYEAEMDDNNDDDDNVITIGMTYDDYEKQKQELEGKRFACERGAYIIFDGLVRDLLMQHNLQGYIYYSSLKKVIDDNRIKVVDDN